MAYYYHNYLICNKSAKERITSLDYDDFDDKTGLSGCYSQYVYKANSDCYLVIFDTRGSDICDTFIRNFISNYQSTIWYCVDEDLANQTIYRYEDGNIKVTKRVRYWPSTRNYIEIEIKDYGDYRPLISYYLSDKKIAIDNVIKNEIKEYDLTEEESEIVKSYIRIFIDINTDSSLRFSIPEVRKLEVQVFVNYEDSDCMLEQSKTLKEKMRIRYNPEHDTYKTLISFVNEILKSKNEKDLIPSKSSMLKEIENQIIDCVSN